MALVQIANSGSGATATSKAVAFSGAQTAGNLNLVVISYGSASVNTIANLITSVTDTKGNSYSPVTTWQFCAAPGQSLGQIIYAAPGIAAATAGANTVTVNLSSSGAFFTIVIAEYSGLATTSPVDVFTGSVANSPSSLTAATGSITTTVASDTFFAAFSLFDGPATTLGLTSGFTQQAKYYTQVEADQVGAATGTYSCSCTVAAGASGWVAQLAAFKPSGITGQGITATGIASTNVFGTAVVALGAISPSGIASTNAFGTAVVTPGAVSIVPSGIASTNAFGTAVVTPGAVSIAPSGIASSLAFGTTSISRGAVNIAPSGIASTNVFGTAVVAPGGVGIAPSGIASTNAFGTASLAPGSVGITPSGIASTTVFGNAMVALASGPQGINAIGIASTTAFGTATVTRGAVNIAPSGIASTNAFGTSIVSRVTNLAPSGIASTNAFGTAAVTRGAVNIAPNGIASSLAFGLPTILQPSLQGINATGIGSATTFGTAKINAVAKVQPVPPYTGDPQESDISVTADIAWREEQREEGPWVMPPYALIFPQAIPPPLCERGTDQFHHEWLKTHPRPPRHHGDWRPKSVLPPFKPKAPIKCPH